MADTYIDYDEMEIYGDDSAQKLKALATLSPVVEPLRLELEQRTQAVRGQRGQKREAGEAGQDKRQQRDDERARVIKNLRSFKSHLDAINDDEDAPDIDLGRFFQGGRLGELSESSPAQVLLKADYALAGFVGSPDFPLKAEKQQKLQKLRDALKARLDGASAARPGEISETAALKQAGEAWRVFYRGLKLVVRGLLVIAGREAEFSSFFKDEVVGSPRPSQSEAKPA